ncbi:predicted protein [Nematostella vectensis]|uniref:Uncharacterized protein n=1 Tax=Nematostella vectensis TaxID=45351 RepID=A7TC52_NEMVE|nr:predicted protein [Nematostella vectensis]|eukprot:XP_001618487.1 hypothetical protein NEMVEDRAFT_v1g225085 [Nematostella vectensis]
MADSNITLKFKSFEAQILYFNGMYKLPVAAYPSIQAELDYQVGSQLGDSALAATCLGQGEMFKPGWDEFAIVGKWLGDIMSVIQQATHTNFAMITHEIALEDDNGKDMFFPLVGSKPFCLKVGKYFGTVVYVDKKMNKHVAGSSSIYRNNVITGSRVNAEIEKAKELSMRAILIEAGILKEGEVQTEEKTFTETENTEIKMETEAKPVGLAAKIAAKKAEAAAKREAQLN